MAKSYVLMEDYDNALRLMTRLVSRFPGVQEYAAYLLIALAGCEKEMAMALYKVKPDNTVLGLVFSSAGRIKTSAGEF